MSDLALIDKSVLTEIADKYRQLSKTDDKILMSELPEKMSSLGKLVSAEMYIDDSEWTRPEEFPNLDSIDMSDQSDYFLATYDNRDRSGFYSVALMSYSVKQTGTIEIGYIENDNFILLDSKSVTAATSSTSISFSGDLSSFGHDYIVIKITCADKLKVIKLAGYSKNGLTVPAREQPVVELYVKGTNTTESSNPIQATAPIIPFTVRHVKVIGYKNWTTMTSMFSDCSKLKTIEFIDCEFSRVTSISSLFSYCTVLNRIEGFFDAEFASCKTMSGIFNGCYGFTELELKMKTPSLTSAEIFSTNTNADSASRVEKLIIDMDFSNVSSISLSSLGFKTLRNCKYIDISKCKFSDKLTSLNSAFYGLNAVEYIDMGILNLSNVTTASQCFAGCNRLKTLKAKFDFSSKLANAYYMFNACHLIESIEMTGLSGVTTSGSTAGINAFNKCNSLKYIKLSGLTTKATDLSFNNNGSASLEYVDLSDCDLSATTSNTFGIGSYGSLANLKYICANLPLIYIDKNKSLTKDETLTILNNLPDVTGDGVTHKLYISGKNRAFLSAAETAIATDKGWTITS